MKKGETILVIKNKVKDTILKALENRKEIQLKRTLAMFSFETGFNRDSLMAILQDMQDLELIYIDEPNDAIRTTFINKNVEEKKEDEQNESRNN